MYDENFLKGLKRTLIEYIVRIKYTKFIQQTSRIVE